MTVTSISTAPPRTVARSRVTVPLPFTQRTYGVGTKRSVSARRVMLPGVPIVGSSTSASSWAPGSSRIDVPVKLLVFTPTAAATALNALDTAVSRIAPELPAVLPFSV